MKIVTGLRIKLTEGEDARIWHKKYNNPEINYKIMQAISLGREGTHESRERRSQLAREITEAALELAIGYRLQDWNHLHMARGGISPQEIIKKGIRLNPFPAYWYYVQLGRCYAQKGKVGRCFN